MPKKFDLELAILSLDECDMITLRKTLENVDIAMQIGLVRAQDIILGEAKSLKAKPGGRKLRMIYESMSTLSRHHLERILDHLFEHLHKKMLSEISTAAPIAPLSPTLPS